MYAVMLEMGEGIKGDRFSYPLTLELVKGRQYDHVTIKNQDELFDIVDDHISNNKGKKFKQVLVDLGIKDNTINLVDERTLRLMQLYKFYNNPSTPTPDFWDTQVWYDTVTIHEELKPRGANWLNSKM